MNLDLWSDASECETLLLLKPVSVEEVFAECLNSQGELFHICCWMMIMIMMMMLVVEYKYGRYRISVCLNDKKNMPLRKNTTFLQLDKKQILIPDAH